TREFWMGLEDQVPEPEFVTAPGSYTTVIEVELDCINQGADIRYTTDGSEPDLGSTLYDLPISISETLTIKAKAFLDAFTPSDTIVGEFVIDLANGDLSGEGDVDLTDAILALQLLIDMETAGPAHISGDVNLDNRIGMEEILYILQTLADLR
ncbi:chitobiase/beta-hexosaminidase C-terminal domain-containing protein, partial [Thermodesulfobacteriota bacterium]